MLHCLQGSTRPVPTCTETDAQCRSARADWPQYVGFGDWWASHMPLERLVAAMLDDPFAHVGSVGFDILERLLRGEARWLPTNLPGPGLPNATAGLSLAFVLRSPAASVLPPAVAAMLAGGGLFLEAEEAACVAALLSDAIAADAAEQARWTRAIYGAASGNLPDAESAFKIHSTVYSQLARGWATYAGNRTGIFLAASRPGSSGTDRFLCSGRGGQEQSARNVDAGARGRAAGKAKSKYTKTKTGLTGRKLAPNSGQPIFGPGRPGGATLQGRHGAPASAPGACARAVEERVQRACRPKQN